MNCSHSKRNLYFKGKLLKAKDFEEEQSYFMHQLQLLGTLFAPGVIKGLKVKDKQEGKIVVEKGYAINSDGKILKVDEEIEIYVNEIQGFEHIHHSIIDLFLVPKEIPCEPIISQQHGDEEVFSKMEESISLYVTPHRENFSQYRDFYDTAPLYEDKDLVIFQNIPRYINKNGSFMMNIEVFKKSNQEITYGLQYELESPSLYMEDGPMIISIPSHCMETRKETFPFRIQHNTNIGSERVQVNIKQNNISIIRNEVQYSCEYNYNHFFEVIENIQSKIKEICRAQMFESKEKVYLATFTISLQEDGLIKIDNVENVYLYNYTTIPYLDSLKSSVMEELGYIENASFHKETNTIYGKIPFVDFKKSNHDIYYSSTITIKDKGYWYLDVHPVFRKKNALQSREEIIYGNGLFFDKETHMYEKIQKTILYNHKKNQFEIAIKIPSILVKQIQSIQWIGIKMQKEVNDEDLKLLSLDPSFISLKPKTHCLFTPIFNKEQKLTCYFEVDDLEGSIDEHGMYLSPEREGVYKIKAVDEKGNHAEAFVRVGISENHVCD